MFDTRLIHVDQPIEPRASWLPVAARLIWMLDEDGVGTRRLLAAWSRSENSLICDPSFLLLMVCYVMWSGRHPTIA